VGTETGDNGLIPRLFLVAPEGIPLARLVDCLKAACAAGDVASLLTPPSLGPQLLEPVQALGVALITAGELLDGTDGVQVVAEAQAVAAARNAVGKDRIVGAYAAGSRHFAMEAAEAGADYIAFDQTSASLGGEPIIRWWSDLMEIPCVAFEPLTVQDLDILLPQKPDFIRPADEMWRDPVSAAQIVGALAARLGKT
jgi:thiamine-phosphate pyrophosphorylase